MFVTQTSIAMYVSLKIVRLQTLSTLLTLFLRLTISRLYPVCACRVCLGMRVSLLCYFLLSGMRQCLQVLLVQTFIWINGFGLQSPVIHVPASGQSHNLPPHVKFRYKAGKGTCHSTAYMNQIHVQKRFKIYEVAADCHELMIPQCDSSVAICDRALPAL